MKPGGLFSKLFFSSSYFTIALRERSPQGIAERRSFCAQTVFPATKDNWATDPMLVDDEDKTWLFYEAVAGGKGRIEVAEVRDGCLLSEPTVLLEDTCHYSYPFVFRAADNWYMIPESSAAGEVRLYRAVSFPFRWEQQAVLLRERAVDTTVFLHQGQYWLFTYYPENGTERVYPHAFQVKDWQEPSLYEVPWRDYDPLRVRGGGPFLSTENGSLRPAQISLPNRYGDGLIFYRPSFEDTYSEGQAFTLSAKNLHVHGIFADGLHTYCCSKRFEAIDIRCRDADPFKTVKRLFRR